MSKIVKELAESTLKDVTTNIIRTELTIKRVEEDLVAQKSQLAIYKSQETELTEFLSKENKDV